MNLDQYNQFKATETLLSMSSEALKKVVVYLVSCYPEIFNEAFKAVTKKANGSALKDAVEFDCRSLYGKTDKISLVKTWRSRTGGTLKDALVWVENEYPQYRTSRYYESH